MAAVLDEQPPHPVIVHRRVGRAADLPDGSARGYDPTGAGRDTVFVVRHRGRLRAWRDACPHVDGAPMAWRKDAYLNHDGSRIVCHAHGAQFDIDTGRCRLGPCLGQGLTPVELIETPQGDIVLALPPEPFQETTS